MKSKDEIVSELENLKHHLNLHKRGRDFYESRGGRIMVNIERMRIQHLGTKINCLKWVLEDV